MFRDLRINTIGQTILRCVSDLAKSLAIGLILEKNWEMSDQIKKPLQGTESEMEPSQTFVSNSDLEEHTNPEKALANVDAFLLRLVVDEIQCKRLHCISSTITHQPPTNIFLFFYVSCLRTLQSHLQKCKHFVVNFLAFLTQAISMLHDIFAGALGSLWV